MFQIAQISLTENISSLSVPNNVTLISNYFSRLYKARKLKLFPDKKSTHFKCLKAKKFAIN